MSFNIIRRCWNAVSKLLQPFGNEQDEILDILSADAKNVMILYPEIKTPPKFTYRKPANWISPETYRFVERNQTEYGKTAPLRSAYTLRSRRCPCCFDKPCPRYYRKEKAPKKNHTKVSKKKAKKAKNNNKILKQRYYLNLANEG